jgi:hypothetical protein
LARVLTRDTISFAGGWFIILYQMFYVPPTEVNEWFLLLGGSLIGVPGVAEIIALRGRSTDAPVSPPPAGASSLPVHSL